MNPYQQRKPRAGMMTLAQRLANPAAATTPASGVTTPSYAGGMVPGAQRSLNPNQIQGGLMNMNARNAFQANPQLWAAIQQLTGQANTDRLSPEGRGAFLGQQTDAISDRFDAAENRLSSNLAQRGLSESSAMTGGLASLAGHRAAAQSGLASNLYQYEDQRQQGAQEQLRQLLAGLVSGQGQQASGIAGNMQQMQLQQQQLDQANEFDPLEALAPLLGLAGTFAGGGFGGLGGGRRRTPRLGDFANGGRNYG